MGHYPAADHTAGTMRLVYNEDSGAYAGKIAEAAHTYNAIACVGPPRTHHTAPMDHPHAAASTSRSPPPVAGPVFRRTMSKSHQHVSGSLVY